MEKDAFRYKCKKCEHKWNSDVGAIQFCPKCDRITNAYEFPRHESPEYVKSKAFDDNYKFEEKYKNDPLGWKRAGYVQRSAEWNPAKRRYEWGGNPYKALTSRGRQRATRRDLNI